MAASEFDTEMAAATPEFLAAYGEDVEYLAAAQYPAGAWRTIKMFFPRESRAGVMDMQPQNLMNMFEGWIDSRNNVDGVVNVSELRKGSDADWFRIAGSKLYYIQRVLERNNAGMHHLQLFDGGRNENPV